MDDLQQSNGTQQCVENIIILSDDEEQGEIPKAKRNFAIRQTSKIFRRAYSKDPKRKVRRLIKKSGKTTLIRSTIPFQRYRYFLDFANTLVNSTWRWTVIFLTATFVLTWLLFACIWMMIANSNGDRDEKYPSDEPCLSGISSFSGYFLFSLETQATIGYGTRFINHYCPEGTFIMVLQIIMGSAICGGMVSIVYVKMARPLRLQCKRLFSTNAVICQRDGILCLMFRIRDEDNRHIVGTTIDAYIVENKEHEPMLYTLHLEPPGILIWPLEVVHTITPDSPFWDFSAKDLISKKFEMIVTMQGTSVTTGQCSKTRTSYMSTEILWGRRFKPCVHYDTRKRSYYVNHKLFNDTEEVLTPLCSAQRMEEVMMDIQTPRLRPNLFSFDSIGTAMDANRLNRRRSTVVLTEINKSIELLDDSDSDIEVNSPRILITPDENEADTLLHFNSKENLDMNSKATINDQIVTAEYKPKRKISFGTRVQLISPDRSTFKLNDIDDNSYQSTPSVSNSSLSTVKEPLGVSSDNIKISPDRTLFYKSSNTNVPEIIVNEALLLESNDNITTLVDNASLYKSLPDKIFPDTVKNKDKSSSDENLPEFINETPLLKNNDNIKTLPDNTLLYKSLPVKVLPEIVPNEDILPVYDINESQSQPISHYPKIPPRRKINNYASNQMPVRPYKIDENVVSYLDEIKGKVFASNPPESSKPKTTTKETIDIEELIQSMEKYVNENLN